MKAMFDFGIWQAYDPKGEWMIDFFCGCIGHCEDGSSAPTDFGRITFHAVFVAPVFCHAGCDFSRALEPKPSLGIDDVCPLCGQVECVVTCHNAP